MRGATLGDLLRGLRFLRHQGAQRIALAYRDRLPPSSRLLARLLGPDVVATIRTAGAPRLPAVPGLPGVGPREALQLNVDGALVVDAQEWPWCARQLEPLCRAGALVLPAGRKWIVPRSVRRVQCKDAWDQNPATQYVARSGLKGHYAEFGTFWGRFFFPAYFRFAPLLEGRFFAFDSFQGLSKPAALETEFSAGDFRENTYAFNEHSFRALGEYLGARDRIEIVPGFYDQTLDGHTGAEYGLELRSLSVCIIDCDLLAPTRSVLNFVSPLLEPGALLYLDDWRLCRASPVVGERAAVLAWLGENPDIELVELYRDHWQHQWFIFQRST